MILGHGKLSKSIPSISSNCAFINDNLKGRFQIFLEDFSFFQFFYRLIWSSGGTSRVCHSVMWSRDHDERQIRAFQLEYYFLKKNLIEKYSFLMKLEPLDQGHFLCGPKPDLRLQPRGSTHIFHQL